ADMERVEALRRQRRDVEEKIRRWEEAPPRRTRREIAADAIADGEDAVAVLTAIEEPDAHAQLCRESALLLDAIHVAENRLQRTTQMVSRDAAGAVDGEYRKTLAGIASAVRGMIDAVRAHENYLAEFASYGYSPEMLALLGVREWWGEWLFPGSKGTMFLDAIQH